MRIDLDIPLKLKEIWKEVDACSPPQNSENYISAICTDSRECKENDLFIALEGENGSSENFVPDALKKGCTVISKSREKCVISVKDTTDALLRIAKLYKSKTQIAHTVAVTGSVGKSTTVKFIKKLLYSKFEVHSPMGNYNNHIGVPLTVLSAPASTKVLVAELGMNHKGEISVLSDCVVPDVGIITSIGTSHIGNLGSRQEIACAKLEILDGMKGGYLLVPYDEPLLNGAKNSFTVGRNTSLSSFALNDRSNGTYEFISQYGSISGISFFDKRPHILTDLTFAISVSQILGLTADEIKTAVSSIRESDLRQRFIPLERFTIFDDSYNASLESIKADLEFISKHPSPRGAFLGDVLELGEMASSIHEEVGKLAAYYKMDHLYLYGQYAPHTARGAIKNGMDENCVYINNNIRAPEISVRQIEDNCSFGELILFKASHRLRLDKIADMIVSEERNKNERI